MGITEILKRIWLFSANKIESSEYFSKQPTQVIVELNSSLQHIIVTHVINIASLLLQSFLAVVEKSNRTYSKIQLSLGLVDCFRNYMI